MYVGHRSSSRWALEQASARWELFTILPELIEKISCRCFAVLDLTDVKLLEFWCSVLYFKKQAIIHAENQGYGVVVVLFRLRLRFALRV